MTDTPQLSDRLAYQFDELRSALTLRRKRYVIAFVGLGLSSLLLGTVGTVMLRKAVTVQQGQAELMRHTESLRNSLEQSKRSVAALSAQAARYDSIVQGLQADVQDLRAKTADLGGRLESVKARVEEAVQAPTPEVAVNSIRDIASSLRSAPPSIAWSDDYIDVPLKRPSGTRVSDNFESRPFSESTRQVRAELIGVREEDRRAFRFQIKEDKKFKEDPNRSPVFGEGDTMTITRQSGKLYLAARANNLDALLQRNPQAAVRLRFAR